MPYRKRRRCNITRKELRVVFQKDGLPDGTLLGYYSQNKKLLEGYKKGDGIFCGCCDNEVSASNFEAHAGYGRRRKPYHNIRASNGVSLHKFAMNLQKMRRGRSGGNLLIEGTFRVLNIWEDDVTTCALCRACDSSETEDFNSRTVIICDQCEMGFHVSCLKKKEMAYLEETPRGKWFCSKDCQRIHASLEKLLDCGELSIPETLLDREKKKLKGNKPDISPDLNVKWRILKREVASLETKQFLSTSVAIFRECFGRIQVAGKDLIQQMVDGEDSEILECSGMHCAVLTVDSEVVSAAIVRIFGHEIAELPLVGTPEEYRGQGYFQKLFSCIVKVLAMLNVEKMVLPSAKYSETFWKEKFGFKQMNNQEFEKLKKRHYKMITFENTSILERRVPKLEELDDNQIKPFCATS